MTATRSRPTADTVWKTVLEASLFVFPVALGVMVGVPPVLGTLLGTGDASGDPVASGVGLAFGAGLVVFVVLALLLAVLVPVALYLDAAAVGDLDVEWEPEPVLYAVAGVFFSGLVTMHYLYKRHQHVVEADAWDGWWTVVAAFLVVGAVAVAVLFVVPAVGGAAFGVAALLFGLTPVALYKDAAYVRTTDSEWRPNPVNYYLAAVFGLLFLLVIPVAIYYVVRRYASVGVA